MLLCPQGGAVQLHSPKGTFIVGIYSLQPLPNPVAGVACLHGCVNGGFEKWKVLSGPDSAGT